MPFPTQVLRAVGEGCGATGSRDPVRVVYPLDPESDVPISSHGPGVDPSSIRGPRAFPCGQTGQGRQRGRAPPGAIKLYPNPVANWFRYPRR